MTTQPTVPPLLTVTDHTAHLTPTGRALLTQAGLLPTTTPERVPLDRAELEAVHEVALPAEFTPYAVFDDVDNGVGGTCTVAYGSDGGGSYLFCLSCEAQGIFEGATLGPGGTPDCDDVEAWHVNL